MSATLRRLSCVPLYSGLSTATLRLTLRRDECHLAAALVHATFQRLQFLATFRQLNPLALPLFSGSPSMSHVHSNVNHVVSILNTPSNLGKITKIQASSAPGFRLALNMSKDI